MVEDPELEAALDRAAGAVPHRSRASLVRELAIIGAEKIGGRQEPSTLDRLLSIPGAVAPASDVGGIDAFFEKYPLGEVPADDPYGVSRALEEQREERP